MDIKGRWFPKRFALSRTIIAKDFSGNSRAGDIVFFCHFIKSNVEW